METNSAHERREEEEEGVAGGELHSTVEKGGRPRCLDMCIWAESSVRWWWSRWSRYPAQSFFLHSRSDSGCLFSQSGASVAGGGETEREQSDV